MALGISTNNAALQAAAAASSVNRDLETSMARLSTGKRINSAADDAAGVAIASRLTSEIRGTDQAVRNALDGQALIDTAEGGHKEIESILQRMREVAVQAANDTNSADDRVSLNAELNALMSEIDRIASVTTWAGQNMMDTDGKAFSFQVGSSTGSKNQIAVTINSASTAGLALSTATLTAANTTVAETEVNGDSAESGNTIVYTLLTSSATANAVAKMKIGIDLDGSGSGSATTKEFASTTQTDNATPTNNAVVGGEIAAVINSDADMIKAGLSATSHATTGAVTVTMAAYTPLVDNAAHARVAVTQIDAALKEVNTQRSELGAVSNRLTHTVANLTNISTNLSSARGSIEDADFALETTELAKNQILQQASTAMLAQANASKQNVLSLLQR